MTQEKPTLKKKSKSSSPAPKTPDLFIFDVAGGKLVAEAEPGVGRVWLLRWAANLTFSIESSDGGRRLPIKANLHGAVCVDETYYVPEAAVKGWCICADPWLRDLYERFKARAKVGEFRLNPYAKPETVVVMQGDGDVSGEEAVVNTLVSRVSKEGAVDG